MIEDLWLTRIIFSCSNPNEQLVRSGVNEDPLLAVEKQLGHQCATDIVQKNGAHSY